MNLCFTCESRDTLKSFTLFITVKAITKLNLRHRYKFEIEFQKISRRSSRSSDNAELVISRCVLQRTAKKCTKIYNARAQLLFCSLDLLFSDVPVAVAVVVFLNSLLFEFWPRYSNMLSQKCSTLNKLSHGRFYKQKLPVIIEVSFEKVAHFPKVPAHTGLTTLDCRKRRHWKSQNWRAVRICEWLKPWCNVLKDQQSRELRRIRTTCRGVYLYDNANHGKYK